jgi:hypothetical protein
MTGFSASNSFLKHLHIIDPALTKFSILGTGLTGARPSRSLCGASRAALSGKVGLPRRSPESGAKAGQTDARGQAGGQIMRKYFTMNILRLNRWLIRPARRSRGGVGGSKPVKVNQTDLPLFPNRQKSA